MNNNVTIGAHTYELRSLTTGGSVRVDTTTGLNTPVELQIKQQEYKDSQSKLPGHVSQIRLEIDVPVKGGLEMSTMSMTTYLRVPLDTNVSWDQVEALVARGIAALSDEAIKLAVFQKRGV